MPKPLQLAAIDPGKHYSGVALFNQSKLVSAMLVPSLSFHPTHKARRVVVEKMQDRGEVPSRDLFDVAIHGAILAGRFCGRRTAIETIWASGWKGQRKKQVDTPYTLKVLTMQERALLEHDLQGTAKSLQHNVTDAVGIGLWALGRRRSP